MNHVFCLRWSRALGALVPVPEVLGGARRRLRRRALLAGTVLGLQFAGGAAWASGPCSEVAGNLIANCGFELPVIPGSGTQSGNWYAPIGQDVLFPGNTGQAAVTAGPAYMYYQPVTGLISGALYKLSFYFSSSVPGAYSNVSVTEVGTTAIGPAASSLGTYNFQSVNFIAVGPTDTVNLVGGSQNSMGFDDFVLARVAIDGSQSTFTFSDSAVSGASAVFGGGTLTNGVSDITATNFSLTGNGGTIDDGGNTLVFTGTFSDDAIGVPGHLTIANTGLGGWVVLVPNSGINTFSGGVTVQPGARLQINNGSALGTGALQLAGSPTQPAVLGLSAAVTLANNITVAGDPTVTVAANTTSTFTGSITDGGTPGDLVVNGGGTLVLAPSAGPGSNTYSGGTEVQANTTLRAGTVNALPIAGALTLDTGAVFDLANFDQAISTLSGPGSVTLGSATLSLTNAAGSFDGAISGTGGLTIAAGTETLTGANLYSGATAIQAGATLQAGAANVIASSSGLSISSGGTFALADFDQSVASLSGNGAVALGAGSLTLTNASGSFAGVLSGNGGLTLAAGSETLSGANLYTGPTVIEGGATLHAGAAGTLPQGSALSMASGATLDLSGFSQTAASLSGFGAITLGSGTLTLANASGSYLGAISGTGGLTIGGGTEGLAGTNSYTGGTVVQSGGTLQTAAVNTLPTGGAVTLDAGGALNLEGFNQSITSLSGGGSIALGGATLTLSNAGGSYAGAMGGAGALVLAAGTEILSGSNFYTGGTFVRPGAVLQAGAANTLPANGAVVLDAGAALNLVNFSQTAASLTGAGNVALGSATLTLGNATGTYAGAMSGSGGLVLAGGTQTLTGANSYTGGTALRFGATLVAGAANTLPSGGALALDAGSSANLAGFDQTITSLSGAGAVALGTATLTLANAADTFSGAMSGGGALTVAGGTETLAGANTYGGGTFVRAAATLQAGAVNTLPAGGSVTLESGATLNMAGFNQSIGALFGAGNVALGSGLLTLTNASGTYAGSLSGSGGFTLAGGTETLTGNSTYTGTTTVGAGTLLAVNGSITGGALVVQSGGTLRGTGVVGAPTQVAGTLRPGNSPGTLVFTAPVTQADGSTLALDIDGTGTSNGAGNYSRVIVQGGSYTAAGTLQPVLRGMTGSATNSFTPVLGQSFRVVQADGGLLGSFSALAQPDGLAAGTRMDALYASTSLLAVNTPVSYANLGLAGLAETPLESAVGRVVDSARPAAGLRMTAAQQALYAPLYLLPGNAIAPALNEFSPAIYGDGQMAAREAWYSFTNAVAGQQAARRGGLASASTAPSPDGATIWMSGLGQFSSAGSQGNAAGFNSHMGGAMAGIDYPVLPGARAGVAVGGGSIGSHSGMASETTTAAQVAIYGSATLGMIFVDAQGSYMHLDRGIRREMPVWNATARGTGTAQGGGGQVNAGVHLQAGAWQVEPTLGLSSLGLAAGSITESSGGSVAERAASHTVVSVQSFAGARVATGVAVAGQPLNLHGVLGWTHEFADTSANTTATLQLAGLGGGGFTAPGAPISRDAARVGAGADLPISPRLSVFAAYDASLGGKSTAQYVSGGVRFSW